VTKARPPREAKILQRASEHVYYELWMLEHVAGILTLDAVGEGAILNALIESFTIHARSLLQFFHPRSPRPDDVLAQDFFPTGPTWEDIRGALPKSLTKLEDRVGKEIAHLTYARLNVAPEDKLWQFNEVRKDIRPLADLFCKHVDQRYLGPSWKAPRHPDA